MAQLVALGDYGSKHSRLKPGRDNCVEDLSPIL